MKMPVEQFAAMLGINVHTLRNREQGRRIPEGPTMVLRRVVDKHPQAVLDAVRTLEQSQNSIFTQLLWIKSEVQR